VLWGFGQWIYSAISGRDREPTRAGIGTFMKSCPPFSAAIFGLVMAWYNGSLNGQHGAQQMAAGRVDLLMATYLPYCSQFVSADGPQIDNLRQVAVEAGVDCDVVGFSKLEGRFNLVHAY
jgi:hypothetical protein